MLGGLKLWNFNSNTHCENEINSHTFMLKTCQRTLILAFDSYPFKAESLPLHELHEGETAYLYLLETICGLKSKLIGENEIVGQFKEAYKNYCLSTLKDTKLLLILEKLFKDAKDIRTEYLIGISQKTYASLTRKHLIQRAKADHIVVIGSGNLAEDLINQFKKKATVSICARNTKKVEALAKTHLLNIIPWDKRFELINEPYMANTIGNDCIIFDDQFFAEWSTRNSSRLFVDLGSPSVISTDLTFDQGIVRLDDIFNEGAIVEDQKMVQIELARNAMMEITQKRKSLLAAKLKQPSTVLSPQMKSDVRYL